MKRLLFTFGIMACFATMLVSCGSSAECKTNYLRVDVKGAQDSFTIEGLSGNCEVIYAPEWVVASIKDNVVSYNIGENKEGAPREGCLVIGNASTRVGTNIFQGTKPSYLILSSNKVQLPREGGSAQVTIATDGGKIEVKSTSDVEATLNGNYLTLTAQKNDGMQILSTIKVSSGKLSKFINVTIAGEQCPTCNSTGYLICKKCEGKGMIWGVDGIVGYFGCSACGGRGYTYRVSDPDFRKGAGRIPCPTCNKKRK